MATPTIAVAVTLDRKTLSKAKRRADQMFRQSRAFSAYIRFLIAKDLKGRK